MAEQRSFVRPTLKHLSDQDIEADVVERYIATSRVPPKGFRKDWHGFADIIGFDRDYLYAVQVCRAQDMDAHARKILTCPAARQLVSVSQLVPRILLYGWRDVRGPGRGGPVKTVAEVRVLGLAEFLDNETHHR